MEAWKAYSIGDTGALRPLGYQSVLVDGTLMDAVPQVNDANAWQYYPGSLVEARCLRRSAYWVQPECLPIRQAHTDMKSWGEKCQCGFYARKDRDDLLRYLLMYCKPYSTIGIALAPVMLEGWVVTGSMGYRAEKLRVLPPEIVLTQNHARPTPLGHQMQFKEVSEFYDAHWIEARVVTWAEWKDKEEAWILERSRKSRSLNQTSSPFLRGNQSLHSYSIPTVKTQSGVVMYSSEFSSASLMHQILQKGLVKAMQHMNVKLERIKEALTDEDISD